ncbi:MAG: hypothetical protein RJB09_1680, partial [Pseudomonadota bacterium]
MSRIGKTIEDLNRYGQQWLAALPGGQPEVPAAARETAQADPPDLVEIGNFGPNPGQLRM